MVSSSWSVGQDYKERRPVATIIKDENIQIDKLSLGPFGTNCYILSCPGTGKSVLVDTPAEGDKILSHLKGSDPKYIIITHNHMDHLDAFREVKADLDIPVTYEAMKEAGSAIGSGAVGIVGKDVCPVTMAQEAITFLRDQSYSAKTL